MILFILNYKQYKVSVHDPLHPVLGCLSPIWTNLPCHLSTLAWTLFWVNRSNVWPEQPTYCNLAISASLAPLWILKRSSGNWFFSPKPVCHKKSAYIPNINTTSLYLNCCLFTLLPCYKGKSIKMIIQIWLYSALLKKWEVLNTFPLKYYGFLQNRARLVTVYH